jgi:DNA repair exonuclease SbcCD ATPase subunit
MKKISIIVGIVAVFTAFGVVPYQARLSAEPDYEKIAQEAERNRELLDIWKQHVKTLTKERDDAYRQLETLKAAGPAPVAPVAQFGGVESAPLPSAAFTEQIAGLQLEVSRLQEELQRKTTGDPTREMQMQFSALQRQLEQVKKENSQLKASQPEEAVSRNKAPSESPIRDEETYRRQARELQYENDTLRAQIEKLQVVEKELASTRGYFTPLTKEMQEKNDRLTAEISSLRSENAGLKSQASDAKSQLQSVRAQADQSRRDTEAALAEIDSLKTQSQRLEADLRTLQNEHEQTAAQNESYKSQLQMAAADREKWKGVEEELRLLRDQHDSLQKAYGVLEQDAAARQSELDKTTQRLASLQATDRERDKYKTALAANLTDMKNLKSNFEAYLESLVASFEERQK